MQTANTATKGCVLSTLPSRKSLILSSSLLHVCTSILFANGSWKSKACSVVKTSKCAACVYMFQLTNSTFIRSATSDKNSCSLLSWIIVFIVCTLLVGLAHEKRDKYLRIGVTMAHLKCHYSSVPFANVAALNKPSTQNCNIPHLQTWGMLPWSLLTVCALGQSDLQSMPWKCRMQVWVKH